MEERKERKLIIGGVTQRQIKKVKQPWRDTKGNIKEAGQLGHDSKETWEGRTIKAQL